MSLAVGTRLGPYDVTGMLGAGGMGEVYKAHDTRLNRSVAIKVLSPGLVTDPAFRHRFEREARAVAALSHPNVLALYDIGTDPVPYVVTELLDGETLQSLLERGPLPLAQVSGIARQIVSGLAAAHDRGIVHRDLKPSNIFLGRDGLVKILDFGVAKVASGTDGVAGDPTGAGATMPGTIVGTVGYMPPEQARGEAVDARSDLFALGAILYEMVSGVRAFQGRSPADTISAVLNRRPQDFGASRDVPPALEKIIWRCLEKHPDDRFQSARDLYVTLEPATDSVSPKTSPSTDVKSIAVLPFENMSADPENTYFSDGLAEELINALTRLPGLHVASRTSAFRFRGGATDIRQIGRDLQVATVLEGSVRRAGNRLRVTAQLIKVADGYHLWSERYDREMKDVFDIQDEIVTSILKAISPALLGEAERAAQRPTDNLEAYELYLRGRHYWHQRSPASLHIAIKSFEQVIAIDGEYTLAYAGLADCFSILRVWGWLSYEQSQPRAREAVAHAMAIDPSLALVHFSQGLYTLYFEPRWRDAADHLRRAVTIESRLAVAQGYLGILRACEYRADEAIAQANVARDLDPLSPFIHFLAAMALNTAGRFEDGEHAARRSLELQPDSSMGLSSLTVALSAQGRVADAVAAGERLVAVSRASQFIGVLGLAYARAGRTADAERLLGDLNERASRGEYIAPVGELQIRLGFGDVAGIRRSLEACIADRTPPFTIIPFCRWLLDTFRGDRNIDDLLDRLFDGVRP